MVLPLGTNKSRGASYRGYPAKLMKVTPARLPKGLKQGAVETKINTK